MYIETTECLQSGKGGNMPWNEQIVQVIMKIHFMINQRIISQLIIILDQRINYNEKKHLLLQLIRQFVFLSTNAQKSRTKIYLFLHENWVHD